jgi:hypothetical protein
MASSFEKEIVRLSERIVSECAEMLGQFGVRAEFRGLRVRTDARTPRCSEIEVALYHGKDLLDVLEFFVMRNGEEVVDAEEVEAWLRRELNAIPAQHDLQPETQ